MNENETSLYPVVEPSAFPITNRNQLESTMLRMQEDPPATTAQTMPTDVDVLELDGEFDYEEIADVPNMTLQAEAVEGAKQAQAAVILAGLPDRYETEGVDRTTLDLPANQVALIQAVAAVQPNTIVVLYNGAPVTMPWLGQVGAVLEMYLPGDGGGEATIHLLYGRTNPSGKLAETFPCKLADTPAYLNFPGENCVTEYREGVFVGYRYYDKKQMEVLFPFGHGLSYTNFA